MNDLSHPDNIEFAPIDSYRVLCKGCQSLSPLPLFLHPVDESCYRLRMQCKRCINKSNKHWRAHRDDIRAARATRKADAERITCVCGTSINVRHRAKHCQSKRHLSVVAVLREHNALSSSAGASAPAAVERKDHNLKAEVEAFLAAAEQRFAADDAVRERRRSLSNPPQSSTEHMVTTACTPPPLEPWMVSTPDSTATSGSELAQSSSEDINYPQRGDSDVEARLDGTEEHADRIEHV